MNWFERHLNLTASIGLTALLISVALSAGVIHWSDSDWLWFDGVVAIATISIYLLCGWILLAKGRSLLWLLLIGIAFPIGFAVFLSLDNYNQPKRLFQDPEYQFVGNSSTRIFHEPLCKQVRAITDETEIWFVSPTEAITRGYSACPVCKPRTESDYEAETPSSSYVESNEDSGPAEDELPQHSPDSFLYDCPRCGRKVRDDWQVCPDCGEALFEDQVD